MGAGVRQSFDSRGRAGSALETRLIFFDLIFRVRRQFSPIAARALGVASHGPVSASSTVRNDLLSLIFPVFRFSGLCKSVIERLPLSTMNACALLGCVLDPRGIVRAPLLTSSYLRARGNSGSRLEILPSASRSRTRKASAPLFGRYC